MEPWDETAGCQPSTSVSCAIPADSLPCSSCPLSPSISLPPSVSSSPPFPLSLSLSPSLYPFLAHPFPPSLSHQTGILGLSGERVDSIDFYEAQHREVIAQVGGEGGYKGAGRVLRRRGGSDGSDVRCSAVVAITSYSCTRFLPASSPRTRPSLSRRPPLSPLPSPLQIAEERERITTDASSVMPAAFVSFRTRWAAAVAAQTQQSRDRTQWITLWAPETRDVVWANLSVNFLSLNARMVAIGAAVVAIILFYTIPVSFVQSLTNLDNLVKTFPWLQPVVAV